MTFLGSLSDIAAAMELVRFVPEADIRANEFDVACQPTIPLSPT